jgi:tol-pal system protein YbgF
MKWMKIGLAVSISLLSANLMFADPASAMPAALTAVPEPAAGGALAGDSSAAAKTPAPADNSAGYDAVQSEVKSLSGIVEIQQQAIQALSVKVNQLTQIVESLVKTKSLDTQKTTPTPPTWPVADAKTPTQTAASKAAPLPATSSSPQDQIYQQALSLVKQQNYAQAIKLFNSYIAQFPKGQHVAGCHLWLGEVYQKTGQTNAAASEFQTVVNQFPNSKEVPSAILKLGFMASEQNNYKQAKSFFTTVQKQYPNTSASQLATVQVEQLTRAGY